MRREIVGILSVLVLLLVLAGFGCGVISVLPDAGPSIWTDKPDYHPEEIVTISGAGFSPGPVALTVTRPDGEINQIPDVSADSSGSFTATYQLDGILGTYIVNATDSAGQTAQTMFTDGLSDVSVGPQVGTLTYGTAGSVTYTITISWSGGGQPATLTITGLPAGASGVFVPSSVSGATTSTLTVSTSSATPAGTHTFTVSASGQSDTGTLTISAACTTYYRDHDGDNYGLTSDSQCLSAPAGEYTATVGGDCDDNDVNEHPGQTWYKDADNDLYSDGITDTTSCTRPAGYKVASELTATSGDCNDGNAAINPGATEVCNGADDDCDGQTDEEGATGCNTYYRDDDNDGYGQTGDNKCLCAASAPYDTTTAGDCNDGNAAVHPGATEVCNGIDDDCDTLIDEGVKTTYYRDSDGDGYGDPNDSTQACSQPVGYVANDDDNCPNDPLKTEPGQCGCGVADTDTDLDGTPDCNDGCPTDPLKVAPGVCGCGVADTDTDLDGTPDCNDGCPTDPNKINPGVCGCGVADTACGGGGTQGVSEPLRILLLYSTKGGSVTTPGEGAFQYLPGRVVDLVATPDAGYRFVEWTPNVDTTDNVAAAATNITMNGDYAIKANFEEILEIPEYDLTISSTAGGSVTVPGEGTFAYDAGTVVGLVATPAANYRFVSWTDDVDTIANVNAASTTISMNGDYSITANFAEIPPGQFALTTSSTAGGSVTTPGEGTFTYDEGTLVDLEAEPEEGYRFVNWTGDVDDVADADDASTTITMNDNYSITATFRAVGGCFIATAAYGTPTAEQIDVLREFRDAVLLESTAGSQFVALYYQLSPPVADFIAGSSFLKTLVRELLVDPIVWVVEATGDIWQN